MRVLTVPATLLAFLALGCGARSELNVEQRPFDAGPTGNKLDCTQEGQTSIYVVTQQLVLLRFDPSVATFSPIGTIACPSSSSPFSMGVNRKGKGFVVFEDGNLFEVSTKDASCSATTFQPDQQGFHTFGMAFATDALGPSEKLYVSESSYQATSRGLATIDTSTFELAPVGAFQPELGDAIELTGTGNGRLFAFSLPTHDFGSHLAEVDPKTGDVLHDTPLPIGSPDSSFAFAFWGGAFYLFTSNGPSEPTLVTRYRPSDGTIAEIATLTDTVVGVGVSTCAPE